MAELLEQYQAYGTKYQKKRASDGRVYHVKKGDGQVSDAVYRGGQSAKGTTGDFEYQFRDGNWEGGVRPSAPMPKGQTGHQYEYIEMSDSDMSHLATLVASTDDHDDDTVVGPDEFESLDSSYTLGEIRDRWGEAGQGGGDVIRYN